MQSAHRRPACSAIIVRNQLTSPAASPLRHAAGCTEFALRTGLHRRHAMIQLVQYADLHETLPALPAATPAPACRSICRSFSQVQRQHAARAAFAAGAQTPHGPRAGAATGRELQHRGARLSPPGAAAACSQPSRAAARSCWTRIAQRRKQDRRCAARARRGLRRRARGDMRFQRRADRSRARSASWRRRPASPPRGTTTSSPCGKLWTNTASGSAGLRTRSHRPGIGLVGRCGRRLFHVKRRSQAHGTHRRAHAAGQAPPMFHVKPPSGAPQHGPQPCG